MGEQERAFGRNNSQQLNHGRRGELRASSRRLLQATIMGKEIPRGFEKIRSGEQLNLKMRGFTNVASLTAAGVTAAKNVGALVYLSTGGTGSVPCLAISDGTNWKQVAIGANAI